MIYVGGSTDGHVDYDDPKVLGVFSGKSGSDCLPLDGIVEELSEDVVVDEGMIFEVWLQVGDFFSRRLTYKVTAMPATTAWVLPLDSFPPQVVGAWVPAEICFEYSTGIEEAMHLEFSANWDSDKRQFGDAVTGRGASCLTVTEELYGRGGGSYNSHHLSVYLGEASGAWGLDLRSWSSSLSLSIAVDGSAGNNELWFADIPALTASLSTIDLQASWVGYALEADVGACQGTECLMGAGEWTSLGTLRSEKDLEIEFTALLALLDVFPTELGEYELYFRVTVVADPGGFDDDIGLSYSIGEPNIIIS
jgi:hypothetical protein